MSKASLDQAYQALRRDLIHEDGPQISTMRNYRFAIWLYSPRDEFALRAKVQTLVGELTANGWVVLTLSLKALLLDRLRRLGGDTFKRLIAGEKRALRHDRPLSEQRSERGLSYLGEKLAREIEGPNGIAREVAEHICRFADEHPEKAERTLVIVGRAGALNPFFRTSSLLKHIDGRTRNVPVVLLYPGERRGESGLSFMGVLEPDSDYRPRIYS